MAELLSDDEIKDRMPTEWEHSGDEISRTYSFDTYMRGAEFVPILGKLAEEAFHHPSISVGYQEIKVSLTTHDAGGITENDTSLAAQYDDAYEEY
jgi:4a-hydroxytetrahydrobiopterin dehydratase